MSQEAPSSPDNMPVQLPPAPEAMGPPRATIISGIGATALAGEGRKPGFFRRRNKTSSQGPESFSVPADITEKFEDIIRIAEKRITGGYSQYHDRGIHMLETALQSKFPGYKTTRQREEEEAFARKHLGNSFHYQPTERDLSGDVFLAPYKARLDAAKEKLKPILLSDVQEVARTKHAVEEHRDTPLNDYLTVRNEYTRRASKLADQVTNLENSGYFNTAVIIPSESNPTATPIVVKSTEKAIANIDKVLNNPVPATPETREARIDPRELQRQLAERKLQRELERDAREEEKAQWEREDHERRRARREEQSYDEQPVSEPTDNKPKEERKRKKNKEDQPRPNGGALSREYHDLYRTEYKKRGGRASLTDDEAFAIRSEKLAEVAAKHFGIAAETLTEEQIDQAAELISTARESFEKGLLRRIESAKKLGILTDEDVPSLLSWIGTEDLKRAGDKKKSLKEASDPTEDEKAILEYMQKNNGKLPSKVWEPIRQGIRDEAAKSHLKRTGKGGGDDATVNILVDALNAAHQHKLEFESDD